MILREVSSYDSEWFTRETDGWWEVSEEEFQFLHKNIKRYDWTLSIVERIPRVDKEVFIAQVSAEVARLEKERVAREAAAAKHRASQAAKTEDRKRKQLEKLKKELGEV
jgi:hypothetical protein